MKKNKISANTFIVSLVVFFCPDFLPPIHSHVLKLCIFCFFPPWSDDQITNSAYSGTRNESIYASFHRRYAWLCFQKDRLHSSDATTIPVGSFRRYLWMSLYEAYFVWLPIMYFQCAVCAHLCLDLRRLGCGWLWDECSPRLLGSHKPFRCRSSRM